MNKKLALTTVGIYLLLAGVIFSITALIRATPIKASVYPREITTNDYVYFSDSTQGVQTVLWAFDNGDTSNQRQGKYQFKEAGKHLVRLTINKDKKQDFWINVVKPEITYNRDSSVFIYANNTGIISQKIHFKAMGNGIEWCEWYFGETGKIDSRTTETFYSFKKAGTHEVKLVTNLNHNKPSKHKITIVPHYKITENIVIQPEKKTTDDGGGSKGGNELIDKLQAIARGDNFTKNYNYIVQKHLCSKPNTPVLINGNQSSDFYSYCQSLQINSGTIIESVDTEISKQTNCVSRLIIKQQ